VDVSGGGGPEEKAPSTRMGLTPDGMGIRARFASSVSPPLKTSQSTGTPLGRCMSPPETCQNVAFVQGATAGNAVPSSGHVAGLRYEASQRPYEAKRGSEASPTCEAQSGYV